MIYFLVVFLEAFFLEVFFLVVFFIDPPFIIKVCFYAVVNLNINAVAILG